LHLTLLSAPKRCKKEKTCYIIKAKGRVVKKLPIPSEKMENKKQLAPEEISELEPAYFGLQVATQGE